MATRRLGLEHHLGAAGQVKPEPDLELLMPLPGWRVSAPVIEISMITMIIDSAASRRHAREPLLLGDTTDRLPPRSLWCVYLPYGRGSRFGSPRAGT